MSNMNGVPSTLSECQDYVVIDKPAGLIVHPARVNPKEHSLVDWLIDRYPEVKDVGDEPEFRPGIVHRLDRGVSGVMVVARNQDSFEWLKLQFKQRKVKKEYLALVYGQIKRNEGEINLPLKKGYTRTQVKPRGSEASDQSIKSASTYFEVLERFNHYTLIKIELKTGRTNQIRAHFLNYGNSVVGDTKYRHPRYKNRKAFTKFVKFDRVFLHASKLGFYNRSSEWCQYEAELPQKLRDFLSTLV